MAVPGEFGNLPCVPPIILRTVQLIPFPMFLDRVGIHQMVSDLLLFQLLGQQLPKIVGWLHGHHGAGSVMFLAHSFQPPQEVVITSPLLCETELVKPFGLFVDHHRHILLQCQVDPHMQGSWWNLP